MYSQVQPPQELIELYTDFILEARNTNFPRFLACVISRWKFVCEKYSVSNKKLSQLSGVEVKTLSALFNLKRTNPTLLTVINIEKAIKEIEESLNE